MVFKWLFGEFNLDQIDADSWDLSDYNHLPNTEKLADQLRLSLQETEELPKDHSQMFDDALFKFDTNLIGDVISLYEVGVRSIASVVRLTSHLGIRSEARCTELDSTTI